MRILYKLSDKSTLDGMQFLSYWQDLPEPTGHINITPEPHDHWGTSMDEDTIRITGSRHFINDMLAHLKPLLAFNNEQQQIIASLHQLPYEHAGKPEPDFVFRFSLKYREAAAKLPKGPIPLPRSNPTPPATNIDNHSR